MKLLSRAVGHLDPVMLAVGAAEDALGLAQAEHDANLGHGPVDPVLGDLDGSLELEELEAEMGRGAA